MQRTMDTEEASAWAPYHCGRPLAATDSRKVVDARTREAGNFVLTANVMLHVVLIASCWEVWPCLSNANIHAVRVQT